MNADGHQRVTNEDPSAGRWQASEVGFLVLLASIHLALVVDVLRRKTPTVDEVAHLPAGISYLEQGTFKMYRQSPPLGRLIPAIGARTADPKMHYEGTWKHHEPPSTFLFAFGFLAVNADTPDRYLAAFQRGRIVIGVWSALTIPFLYAWGRWWFGRRAGGLAAVLWTLCPNIIAHAGMVTTDLATTSVCLVASLAFARWLDRPTWVRAMLAGTLLGAAQLIKFSSLVLVPLWAVWLVVQRRSWPWQLATTPLGRQYLAIHGVCLLLINAGYGFEGSFRPLGSFPFMSDLLTRPRRIGDGPIDRDLGSNSTYNAVFPHRVNRFRGTWLESFPCPLPVHYVAGFDEQKLEADGTSAAFPEPEQGHGYQVYLRGELRRRGWWYYYAYALALKVPISTWLLVAMGGVGAVLDARRIRAMPMALHRHDPPRVVVTHACAGPQAWHPAATIPTARIAARDRSGGFWDSRSGRVAILAGLAVGIVASFSFLTDINLGLRYVLPALGFAFLLAGAAAGPGRAAWWNWTIVGALAANVVSLARIHPHELSYFNLLAGGPADHRWHLIDSNLDWGQDLRGLARWIERHPEWRDVRIAYMGWVPPEFEGIGGYRMAPRDLRRVPSAERLLGEEEADPASYGPQPGKFAVSVNFERGMHFHTPLPLSHIPEVPALHRERPAALVNNSTMVQVPAGAYAYFQHLVPRIEPQIGYSILLYDVSLDDANRVRRLLGIPLLEQPLSAIGGSSK